MTDPTVSAVIPVHNGENFLAEAVESVLAQTRPVLEVVVVDDGSTDGTAAIAQGFGGCVRHVPQPQGGVSAARNRGAREARGDLIAFLDHDDAWLAHKLELQVAALRAEPATMAMCALQPVTEEGRDLEVKRLGPSAALAEGMLLFDGTPIVSCSSTGVIDRLRFISMGGFDERLSTSADWDLLLRVALEGSVAYVDEPLVRYRVHDRNMSRDIAATERDMSLAFDKAFEHPALPPAMRRRRREAYGRLYRMLAGSYRDAGERRQAIRAFARAVRHDPSVLRDVRFSASTAGRVE
jgi:glycosyltransferase involved in cell wall biosynthesis